MDRWRRRWKGLGGCCRNPLPLCPRWVWLKALWLQNGSLETVEMGPVLWARLAESGTLPPGIVWEPCCQWSLGVSIRGWRAYNSSCKCSLCYLPERDDQLGCISRCLSQGIFVLVYIKVGFKRLGNPKNTWLQQMDLVSYCWAKGGLTDNLVKSPYRVIYCHNLIVP